MKFQYISLLCCWTFYEAQEAPVVAAPPPLDNLAKYFLDSWSLNFCILGNIGNSWLIFEIMLQWRERTGEVFATVAGWPEAVPVSPVSQELLVLFSAESSQGRTQHSAAAAHLSDLPQGLCRPWEAGETQSYSRQRSTVPLRHLRPCLQGTRYFWETQVSGLAFFFSLLESRLTYAWLW